MCKKCELAIELKIIKIAYRYYLKLQTHNEIIHQIYGQQSLQNGGEGSIERSWITFCHG